MTLYKVSSKTRKEAAKYRAKGYKINQTSDSRFLSRNPRGRKDMKRIGKKLGTGGGRGSSTTVFAYKDVKRKKKRK